MSFVPVDESFSVGQYAGLAHAEIDNLLAGGQTPIVVGGTGLYLRAALAQLDLRPAPSAGVRERLELELVKRGPAVLHTELAATAPEEAARIDPADGRRIVRALELAEMGELQQAPDESQLWSGSTRHPTRLVALVMERDELYRRIDERVDHMVAAGAVAEVQAAEAGGASKTARKALGFQELLDGDVEAMKRRSRNLAKRQLTWLRKLAGVELHDVTGRSADEVAAALR